MINPLIVGLFCILYIANAVYVDGWESIIREFRQ